VLAIAAGLLIGLLVVMLGDGVSATVAPLPAGVDAQDPAALRAVMDQIPVLGFVVLLAAVALAGVAGAWVAARLSLSAHMRNAMIVGALLWAATIVNLFTLPHPVWFAVLSVLIVLPAAWLGGRLAMRTVPAA
jgi:hypothetical protein